MTPLSEVIAAMLRHDPGAAEEFLARQKPDQVAGLLAATKHLREAAYMAMLRDPVAFHAYKAPDPLPEVPLTLFRSSLEAALASDLSTLRQGLANAPLTLLGAMMSLAGQLETAWMLRQRQSHLMGWGDTESPSSAV